MFFLCDLCNADSFGYPARQLSQRIAEKIKTLRLENTFWKPTGSKAPSTKASFEFSESATGNLLCIKERNPSMNTQTDFIRAKLFVKFKYFNTSIVFTYYLYIFFINFQFDSIMTLA